MNTDTILLFGEVLTGIILLFLLGIIIHEVIHPKNFDDDDNIYGG